MNTLAHFSDTLPPTELCKIMERYGSDKGSTTIGWHNYTKYYYQLFSKKRNTVRRVFEVGLGTNNTNIPSNMGVNGKPGASLRGWKEFFPHAQVFGADIDTNCLFQEDRITTFYCDQTSPSAIEVMWSNDELHDGFDIIIDDGLHEFRANACFFEHSIHKLNPGGLYIIEDIHRSNLGVYSLFVFKWQKQYPNFTFNLIDLESSKNVIDNIILVIHRLY